MITVETFTDISSHRPLGNKSIRNRDRPLLINNFNFKYICKEDGFSAVANLLSDTTFLQQNDLLFKDPSEYFVSMKSYPFNVYKYWRQESGWKSEFIRVANTEIKTAVSKQNVTGWLMPIGADYYPIGCFQINSDGSFLDIQTIFKLYIPFCGSIELNASDILNRKIWVYLSVDFETGTCTAYVQREIPNTERDEELITTATGTIGFDVAIGKTNLNDNSRNMLTGTVASAVAGIGGMIAGAVTGNPLLVGGSFIAGVSGVVKTGWNSSMEHVALINKATTSNSIISPYKCYLEIHEPILVDPNFKYSNVKGRPLEEVRVLKELTGFTKVESINVNSFGKATSSEVDEIKSLLLNGIIL